MPTNQYPDPMVMIERRREAERQVRAKFPGLVKGCSGWHRAISNRMKRL